MLQFHVDADLCTGCGACAEDCLNHAIVMGGDNKGAARPVMADEAACLRCQHCLAICPTGAISILGRSPADSLPFDGSKLHPDLVETLLKGRRSVRHYQERDVDPALLRRALDIAWHAPTGGNAQALHLTVIDKRSVMEPFRNEVHERLARAVADGTLPACTMRGFFLRAPERLKSGDDTIFRGAPHAVFVSTPGGPVTPEADPFIYLSYFELAAHSLGLGTVWCGVLHYVLRDIFPDLQQKLGIPAGDTLRFALLFGYPSVRYRRTVERGPADVRYVAWQ